MVLQFFCPICSESFSSTDELFSTRCGHVFHSVCLRDALARSQVCPSCHAHCFPSDISKLYINCNNLDSQETINENLRLKTELELCIKDTSEFQQKLDESEKNFMQLHEQFEVVQKERQAVSKETQYLKVITKSLEEELNRKISENLNLKEKLEVVKKDIELKSNGATDHVGVAASSKFAGELAVKNRQIETLKKQLNDRTLELEKEIRNSAALNAENLHLQQQVNATTPKNEKSHAERRSKSRPNFSRINTNGGNLKEMAQLFGSSKSMNEDSSRYLFKGGKKKANVLSRDVYHLLQYAKKLHNFGFKYVFGENNAVFAKTHNSSVSIQIVSKEQVDEMIKKYTAFSLDVSTPKNI